MEDNNALAYSGLTPMLSVTSVSRTISFYEQLGFKIQMLRNVLEGDSNYVKAKDHKTGRDL